MAIVKRPVKDGKIVVTSSYFDDIAMIVKDRLDTRQTFTKRESKAKRASGSSFDENALDLAWAYQTIMCWKTGVTELNRYISKLKQSELDSIKEIKYYGKIAEPLKITVHDPELGDITREMTDEEFDAAYARGDFFISDSEWANIKIKMGMK